MGSHQPKVAVLVLDKKPDRFGLSQIFPSVNQNNLAYHAGPVLLPGVDGSPLLARVEKYY